GRASCIAAATQLASGKEVEVAVRLRREEKVGIFAWLGGGRLISNEEIAVDLLTRTARAPL
ncbi:MAG: hypothetical protein ACP6IT_10805, partial [Candidatus Thorarchaeota archaeon]